MLYQQFLLPTCQSSKKSRADNSESDNSKNINQFSASSQSEPLSLTPKQNAHFESFNKCKKLLFTTPSKCCKVTVFSFKTKSLTRLELKNKLKSQAFTIKKFKTTNKKKNF